MRDGSAGAESPICRLEAGDVVDMGMARTGTGTATEPGEGVEEETEAAAAAAAAAATDEEGVCSGIGEDGVGEVVAGDDFWHSRKHLEHMFMVEAEPKKPHPFAHGGGEGVP